MSLKQTTNTVEQKPDPQTLQMQQHIYNTALGAMGMPSTQQVDLQGQLAKAQQQAASAPTWMRSAFDQNVTRLQGQLTAEQARQKALYPQANPIPGVGAGTQAASGMYNAGVAGGQLGQRALSGDQGAVAQLMNPYQSQVMGAMDNEYLHSLKGISNNVNDAASAAGAFGGSRHGIAEGVALGEANRGYQGTVANLLAGGYQQAMGQASSLANMGLSAADGAHGLSEYERQVAMQQDPALRQLGLLTEAVHGTPYGTSTSQPLYRNPVGDVLGMGLTAAGIYKGFGLNGGKS